MMPKLSNPQFCQPAGWCLSNQRQQPTFYTAVLTDMDGDRHYCATFTFYETIAMTQCKPDDEDDEPETNIIQHSSMYAPKTLILLSRHDYLEAFRVSMNKFRLLFIVISYNDICKYIRNFTNNLTLDLFIIRWCTI